MLRESEGYVSGQQICEKFHVSRTAVWKVIEQLKEEGYQIEAVRNRGYRLSESPDILSQAEIESRISTEWAGRNVSYFRETDSTNTQAKRLGEEGAPAGTLAVADRVWMLENAVYSVISPEGCASILWKDAGKAGEAAACLKLTAQDAKGFGFAEEIIPEEQLGQQPFYAELRRKLTQELELLSETPDLKEKRYESFRAFGRSSV